MIGPTGVGKTELAKTLSDYLFKDPSCMLTVDMSEYMEAHSISRLIGAYMCNYVLMSM
jgi:ATP-dependent Clp protease ATP-binding subunit ClpB